MMAHTQNDLKHLVMTRSDPTEIYIIHLFCKIKYERKKQEVSNGVPEAPYARLDAVQPRLHSTSNPKMTRIRNLPPNCKETIMPKVAAPLILFDHNSLHHALEHLVVELECLVPGELNILGQVIRQNVHELAVPTLVEKRLVSELSLFVRLA